MYHMIIASDWPIEQYKCVKYKALQLTLYVGSLAKSLPKLVRRVIFPVRLSSWKNVGPDPSPTKV